MQVRFHFPILALSAWLAVTSIAFSLDPRKSLDLYRHNVWTVDDGLPMNSLFSICQTSDGYIWLGTETCLARFDGLEFDEFNRENTPALHSGLVLTLRTDRSGTLWIGTRGGGLTRYQNGIFTTLTTADGLLSDEVWALTETADGAIWIGTRNGLNLFYNGAITTIPLPPQLANHNIRALLTDRLGRIWVGTRGGGIALVEKKGAHLEAIDKGMRGLRITSFLEDRTGDLWVGTSDAGLIQLRENEPAKFYSTRNGLPTNFVTSLLEDQAGNFWIGTYGGGLCVRKNGQDSFAIFNSSSGLSSNAVLVLFEDREKTLWIGTEGGGLNNLRDTPVITYTTKNGLSYNTVTAVFQDSRNLVWIGNMSSGVDVYTSENGRFAPFPSRRGLLANAVCSISENPPGTLWFGTLGGGINSYNVHSGKIDTFTMRDGLSDNFVRALYRDATGTMWAGTDSGGLHRYEKGKFVLADNLGFRINVINSDYRQNMWVGTWGNGLYRLGMGKKDIYTTASGLSDNTVLSIYPDRDNILWVGTFYGGLNRFQNGKFSVIGKKNGLPDNAVYDIQLDQNGYFWISSNRGIYCVKRQELIDFSAGKITHITPYLFTNEDGMRSMECNGGFQPAGLRTRKGSIWFPTTLGVCMLNPENIGSTPLPPPVLIKQISINGVPQSIHHPANVPAGDGILEFHYTALSFTAPKTVRFRYRLSGVDSEWIEAGTRRVAHYSGVPAGSHYFQVSACGANGIWNSSGASFDFRLRPLFIQTRLFTIGFPLLVIVFCLVFALLMKKLLTRYMMRRKYRKSNLTAEESAACLKQLLHAVEIDRVYRDTELTLQTLARKLSVTPRHLSQVINESLHSSFFEFINKCRIDEAKRLLTSPRSDHLSVLEIAHKVGFSSKSAFNRAFRHFTHTTPSRFRSTRNDTGT